MTSTTPPVTVYSTTGCVQCGATYRALDSASIAYVVIDVSKDHATRDRLRKQYGYMQAPVVITATGEHWYGFRPDRIAALTS